MDEPRVHGRRAEQVDCARIVRLAALGVIPDVLRHLLADTCLELHFVRLCARRPKRDRDRLEHAARPTFLACGIDLVAHRKDVRADASVFLDRDAVAVVGVARAAESMAVQIVHVLPVRLTVANGPVLLEVGFRKLECRAHPDLAGEALGERIALEAASVDRKLLPALVLDEIRVVERRLGVDEVGSGVEALVPLEDLLLVYLGSAGLHEVGPAVVPEAGNALRVARAVVLRPGLVYPAVDLRGAPRGVHEADRNVEHLVELPAHPVECRTVLAHRLVGRGLPLDSNRVLARKRRVPVVAVVHEERADVGVALRLLEELLAADRKPPIARERVGHVRLAASEPHVAEKDVGDRVRLLAALGGDRRRLLVRLLRRELHGPAALLVRRRLANGLSVERDRHLRARLGEAPHGRCDIALNDHVVRADGRELEFRRTGCQRNKERNHGDCNCRN